ncbi:MAG: response regulator [Flavisolibacter sp.]
MKTNTILWADDDADDLHMMRDILKKNNKQFELIEVQNGKEAIDYLHKQPQENLPCLIILDINMPVLDGKKALSIIKQSETLQSIPTVVFTTSNSELDRMYCQKFNTEMITKPPDYKSLQSAVLRLLDFCGQ